MTTTVLNTKISGLVKQTHYDIIVVDIEKRITDHYHNSNYITTLEFNNQANLVSKTDFDKKAMTFNRNITSYKTQYFEVQKKLV